MFYRPDQTKFKSLMRFYKNEILKTNHYENHMETDIVGKCFVLHKKEYIEKKPEDAAEEDTYVCESLYNIETGSVSRIKDWGAHLPQVENARDISLVDRGKTLVLERAKLPPMPRQYEPIPSPPKRKREVSEDSERVLPKRRATLNVTYDTLSPSVKTISVTPSNSRTTRSTDKPQFHLPGPLDSKELTQKQSKFCLF
jgi:hypothetical protein